MVQADGKTPGWQHEIVGWVLVTGVPVLIAAGLFVYLKFAEPTDLESPLWASAGMTVLALLTGFAVWTRGVFVHRAAKRAASEQDL